MLNDLKDSIKAKLYDFNYTPFMSSLVISWILINHKYLLVLFSDKIDVDKKLIMLNDTYTYNAVFGYFGFYILPLAFALFYVFIYPKISKYFYEYTLHQTKKLKEIKQKIEDETPLTQEEAKEIRKQLDKLATERDEAITKLTSLEKTYENRLLKEVTNKVDELVQDKNSLQKQLESMNIENESLKREQEISDREKELLRLELEASKRENIDKNNKDQEDDETQILRLFYKNYKPKDIESLLDEIVRETKMARAKASKIVNDLIKDGFLLHDKNYPAYVSVPKESNNKLVKLFDGK